MDDRTWTHGFRRRIAVERPGRRAPCQLSERFSWAMLTDPRAYAGFVGDDGAHVVIVEADGLALCLADEPAWGPAAPAGRAAAAAILRDALGRPPEDTVVDAFAEDVVADMPPYGFRLTAGDVRCWVLLHAAGRLPSDG